MLIDMTAMARTHWWWCRSFLSTLLFNGHLTFATERRKQQPKNTKKHYTAKCQMETIDQTEVVRERESKTAFNPMYFRLVNFLARFVWKCVCCQQINIAVSYLRNRMQAYHGIQWAHIKGNHMDSTNFECDTHVIRGYSTARARVFVCENDVVGNE